MKQQIKKVFGIDLGTTYSSVAYIDENGQPTILPNIENQPVTPSVVFFDGDNVLVGAVAKESAKIYPDQVVSFIKRAIGEPDFFFEYNSTPYTPEEISSYIIRKVIKDAENHLGEKITDVVITCPAYFGINEREATQKAGVLAGVNVCQIINEPTAAAITYAAMRTPKDKTILVYDLGGGTFDVTLIDIRAGSIEVVCTGGDHNLGGKDWDDRIVAFLAQEFQKSTGITEDILEDNDTCQDLQISVENAKKILSQRKKAPIIISYGGQRIRVELLRKKFQEVTAALLERTIDFTKEMLEEAKKKGYKNFDEIVLVGGATRMPQVTERLESEFSKKPILFEPDGAIAKGAAIFGWKYALNTGMISRIRKKTGSSDKYDKTKNLVQIIEEAPEDVVSLITEEMAEEIGSSVKAVKESMFKVKDVASKSFGVMVRKEDEGRIVFNLIKKNTTVPVNASRDFSTSKDNQKAVKLHIMENNINDNMATMEDSVEIGTAMLTLPPNVPRHTPVAVKFSLNVEGRLKIKAQETATSKTVNVNIETRSVIMDKELKKAKARARKTKVE